jgi:hypothetical protein
VSTSNIVICENWGIGLDVSHWLQICSLLSVWCYFVGMLFEFKSLCWDLFC